MKKKIIILAVMLPVLIAIACLPIQIKKSISAVKLTSVRPIAYSENIYINGLIEPQSKKDIVCKVPLVPQKVYYRVGDYVEMNAVIADVDVDATQSALFNMAEAANAVPQEYMEVLGKINIDEKILQEYVPTQIRATSNGIITSISLIEGAITSPKSVAVTIVKEEQLRLRMLVDEADADKVKKGDTVVFKANATGEQRYLGTVSRIFPTATKTIVGTSQATVVPIYINMQHDYKRLKAGYTISGVIKQPAEKEMNILPYESVLQDENNQEYVYLFSGKNVHRCIVKTGKETPDGVQIISPSLQGQKIVADASAVKNPNGMYAAKN